MSFPRCVVEPMVTVDPMITIDSKDERRHPIFWGALRIHSRLVKRGIDIGETRVRR